MKNKGLFFKTLFLGLSVFLIFFSSCKSQSSRPKAYNSAFNAYITGFTDFEVSRKTPVTIRFTEDLVTAAEIGKAPKKDVFEMSPKVDGNLVWLDTKTLQFTPQTWLPSNTTYSVSVEIDALFPKVPDSLETFSFDFKTKPQVFSIISEGLRPMSDADLNTQNFLGEVQSSDVEELEIIKQNLEANLDGEKINIKLLPDTKSETAFPFEITNIKRKSKLAKLLIKLNLKSSDGEASTKKELEVPAIGQFELLNHKVFTDPDRYMILEFSDPLDPKQDLNGLIKIKDFTFTSAIEGNIVKIFPTGTTIGKTTLSIETGIKNIQGKPLRERKELEVVFVQYLPELALLGKGTIVPQGEILPFPFKAVNLSAVDIRIIKIHEKNIPQFLQINKLEGEYQMIRVGELVAEHKVELDNKLNLTNWNEHVIDLKKMIETEPGAIYRVALGFKREYSLYKCQECDSIGGDQMLTMSNDYPSYDEYEGYDYYEYYDDYGYNYEDRDNPCKSAYFHSGRIAQKNVLASNLGLIAKKGSSDDFFFSVADLNTTDPISGVTLEVYNYQQRLLETLTTDSDGWASKKIDGNPFLLVAKNGKERGYLRLDNGTALSVSNFDVSGATYTKGLKGMIYGERGVWRPGDDIFLTFVLEDKEKSLPSEYPVNLEFSNPQGQIVQRIVSKKGINGFYHFKLKTADQAPTGNYSVKIYVGGSTFYKTIKIETIMPNRLKINFDIAGQAIYKSESQRAVLKSAWLHGAVAENLKADVAVSLENTATEFKGLEMYDFDFDAQTNFNSERQVIFDGQLDANGQVSVPLSIETNNSAPGKLKANFSIKVFEPGGNFSTDAFSVDYHPYNRYVGIKAPAKTKEQYYYATDAIHKMEVALATDKGKLVGGNALVNVEVYKLDWRWWWDDGAEQASYYSGDSRSPHSTHQVTTLNGKGTFDFSAKHDQWGRYLMVARDGNGHKTSKIIYVDWPGYYRTSTDESAGVKMLTFTSSKEKYNVGDNLELNIPTPKQGKLLVSIESGNKVLKSYWIKSQGEVTTFTCETTSEMAPNCYAFVTLIQPQGNTNNDLPIRMYGVLPLNVENKASVLKPVISMPNELEPNSFVDVKVSEATGKAMTYTIAMVDEGLLDLTRYKTPDIWLSFNERQALNVKTFDCYDEVMNAQFKNIKNLLSIGGDMDAAAAGAKKATRFKPVVYYAGPFYLPAGTNKTHKIEIPNYVGSVKTMVVAGSVDFAYGSIDKATPVKKPLMLLGTMPRVVSPGEQIAFPLNVFAMKDHVKEVTVTIDKHEMFELIGANTQKISFKRQGDQTVSFLLKAVSKTGIARLKVTAKSGSEIAIFETELEVRSPNPKITQSDFFTLATGKKTSKTLTLFGMQGTNELSVELSSNLPINLGKRLDYLIKYPYGCVEQTTSSVFPQLFLSKLIKLNGKQKEDVVKNVEAGIQRLSSFQTSDGGFGYWEGNTSSEEWASNYVGHFLIEAQNAGYQTPKDMLKRWLVYQSKMAKTYSAGRSSWQDMTQAYRLYVLALHGKPEMGAMNQLKNAKTDGNGKWYLAASYYLTGQRLVGKELVQKATNETVSNDYRRYTYGSPTRDDAVILEVLTLMKNDLESNRMAQQLSKALSSQEWMSTQTTAFALVAMSKYIAIHPSSDLISAEIVVNGKSIAVNSNASIETIKLPAGTSVNNISVINKGTGSLFVKTINSGVPIQDRSLDNNNLMNLTVTYQDMNGRIIDQSSLIQGTDFKMIVTVSNTSTNLFMDNIALNTMMPSGWEIHNSRLTGISSGRNDVFDSQDVRDDAIYTFFNLGAGQSKTYTFFLNASYIGTYFQPTIVASPMYDETIFARKKGGVVTVLGKKTN
jgi:alpha-2-macroglobulin